MFVFNLDDQVDLIAPLGFANVGACGKICVVVQEQELALNDTPKRESVGAFCFNSDGIEHPLDVSRIVVFVALNLHFVDGGLDHLDGDRAVL